MQTTMQVSYKDFIGIYKNVYPPGFCEHLVEEFEHLNTSGLTMDRKKSDGSLNHIKKDLQIGLNGKNFPMTKFEGERTQNMFFKGLQTCYQEYADQYSILQDVTCRATEMKMQRTDPGGGYHVWHCEQGNTYDTATRIVVYMLYLNTLKPEEAGETEFLYQQMRINPEKNTMVLWPSSFTHPHRGNVVFGNTSKYIITGWFHLNIE